jgi:hypothetical protein
MTCTDRCTDITKRQKVHHIRHIRMSRVIDREESQQEGENLCMLQHALLGTMSRQVGLDLSETMPNRRNIMMCENTSEI